LVGGVGGSGGGGGGGGSGPELVPPACMRRCEKDSKGNADGRAKATGVAVVGGGQCPGTTHQTGINTGHWKRIG